MSKDWMEAEFPRFNPTEERVNKLKEALSRITEESIVEYADYFGVDWDGERNVPTDLTPEEIRQDLEDSVFRAVEAASFEVEGQYWCSEDEMDGQPFTMGYTGGMSWGDEPTDYYMDFQKASHFSEVLKLAVSYAIEDKEASILAHSERIIKARLPNKNKG